MAETKKSNQEKLKEVTTGLETIVGEKPTIEIEGNTYTMRRLGIPDVFKVIKIIGIGVKEMAGMFSATQLDMETAGLAIMAAIPYAEDEILDLLASLLNITSDQIRNENLFPLGSAITIIEALVNHQDLKAFFTQLQHLAEVNPAIQQAMKQTTQEAQSSEQ